MKSRVAGGSCLDGCRLYKNTRRGCAWSQECGSGATVFMLVCLNAFRWAPSHGQTWFKIASIMSAINYNHTNGCKGRERSCHEAKDRDWGKQLTGSNASVFVHCT